MKIWMLLAAVVLAPMSVRAQVNDEARAELVKEIEANRSALLPQVEPLPKVTVRHQPRLNEIKTSVAGAATPAQLAKARKDLADWKTAVIRDLHVESQRLIPTGESLSAFSTRRSNEVVFVMALRQQFASQRVESQAAAVRSASRGGASASWASFFDNQSRAPANRSVPFAAADGAVKVEPLAGAARYKKLRDIAVRDWKANPQIVDAAINEALRQNVDPALVLAVIWQESRFNTKATSPVGARGLMQVMPATGKGLGVANPDDLYDMQTNLRAGVKYLRNATAYLKLNINLADISTAPASKIKALLASYNAGCGAVTKWLREQGTELVTIPYAETRNYVRAIAAKLAGLAA